MKRLLALLAVGASIAGCATNSNSYQTRRFEVAIPGKPPVLVEGNGVYQYDDGHLEVRIADSWGGYCIATFPKGAWTSARALSEEPGQ